MFTDESVGNELVQNKVLGELVVLRLGYYELDGIRRRTRGCRSEALRGHRL